ncbi:MAG: F0F1 ATP synthase subunit B' [Campylobacteraceae bacterium]
MLDFDPVIFCSTIVAFLFLLIVLNQILYKPLLGFMDNRDETIKKDLEDASKNSSDVGVYHDEANKILLDAKNKALEVRLALISKAKEEATQKLNDKKSKLEASYESFTNSLVKEKQELKDGLLGSMPAFQDGIKNKLAQI